MSIPSLSICTMFFCVVPSLIIVCLSSAAASPTGTGTDFDLVDLKAELLNLKAELESRLEKMEADLVSRSSKIDENSVPLGFVYIQLPNQFSPDYIWPKVTWLEVTKEYEGLFFRAEGGGSAEFGLIQEDSTRQITQVEARSSDVDSALHLIDVPKTGWSKYVESAKHTIGIGQYDDVLRFNTSDVEVRPRNTAVRIWKRVL